MVVKMDKPIRRSNPYAFVLWLCAAGVLLSGVGMAMPVQAKAQPTPTGVVSPIPVFAYYYIWYDTTSWNRAKMDYPQLGKYSSDDRAVMRQHIQWAKASGINGFIVSWKSTDPLNRRLSQLEQVAEEENFKLAVIYEGLDFNRNPLPVTQISSDLDYFIKNFASRKAFQIYSKPMVILSGTWKYTPEQISQITTSRRSSLLLLASERNLKGYQRLAGMVDGDAYYWSSVNPDTFSGYQDKLTAMGAAVHQDKGIWIPPAAPGFDATQVGGTSSVDRKNGDTFRTQLNTAMAASPDILGIISWNEYSENSYIEPSQKYGSQYLDILSQFDQTPLPNIGSFDSSVPNGKYPEVMPGSRYIALGGIAALMLAGLVVIVRRHSNTSRNRAEK